MLRLMFLSAAIAITFVTSASLLRAAMPVGIDRVAVHSMDRVLPGALPLLLVSDEALDMPLSSDIGG